MKKLSFLFAMIFAVSMAMAQTAVVNQTNSTPGSTSADITQTGGDEYTKVMQLNDKVNNAANPLSATLKQVGTHNNKGNDALITQTSTGTGNNAATLTVNTSQNGKENLAKQTQISDGFAAGLQDFKATQVGNENKIVQYSIAGNHTFTASQNGSKNDGLQKTLAGVGGSNEAELTQNGDHNQSTQTFAGTNARVATVTQIGNSNVAVQTFDGGAFGGAYNRSSADIVQRDNDDYAYQSQVGLGSYQYAYQNGNGDNESRQMSEGNYNNSYVKQTGKDGFVKVEQFSDAADGSSYTGDGNSAMLSQAGNDSEARIWQDGERNEVVGLGGSGTYAINNAGAFLKVKQDGMDNIVMSRQLVGGSETVNQTGFNNSATVNQY